MRMRFPMLASGPVLLASTLAAGQPTAESPLPEGPGRKTVEAACFGCHGIAQVTRSGFSRPDWERTLARMINLGAPLRKNQLAEVADYLALNFPARNSPAAKEIAGPVKVAIREWLVPQPGTRPHDPLATADGALWYTGQYVNVLGRLDPKTGAIREYPLKTLQSGPHGLAEDKDGNIWFTANFKGYIGKLDPRSGEITEYAMPDPAARDPHSLAFDAAGMLWFTVQGGNFVGRLDPRSGAIRLLALPTPKSLPYGIAINSKGVPFFAEFGANRLASIDPATLAITEYRLLNPGARPRRIAIGGGDAVWYSDYARGYLGRFDPATGKSGEWLSPGGPDASPYGITALDGVIWYSESGVHPNTLVRFDPRSEKFQTWKIPSGGQVVRNMMPTRDGDLVLACSGADRVALVSLH